MSTTTGEAALYQRLRAHLDFLKLPAAAEALPGILDAARTQDRSTVAILEALLAVEVDTTQAAVRLSANAIQSGRVRLHRPARGRRETRP
jgi:hypothetical protein